MSNWAHQQVIWDEIKVNNPAPYLGQTNAQIANLINTTLMPAADLVTTLSASQIFEAIDTNEYTALNADHKEKVRMVLSLGDVIQIGPGSKARAFLLAAFGSGTATRAALTTMVQRQKTRREFLNLPEPVLEAHVHAARVKNGQTVAQANGVLS